jgi:hypothetical protein
MCSACEHILFHPLPADCRRLSSRATEIILSRVIVSAPMHSVQVAFQAAYFGLYNLMVRMRCSEILKL